MNQAEEESFRREVMERGFLVSDPGHADLCIINTCSVTALADKKSRQAIRRLRSLNPQAKIIVTGCGANEAENLAGVDLIISNKDKNNTVEKIINKFQIKDYQTGDKLPVAIKYRTRALLKIQDGCNNFCAYCIVPFLRGRETSIPVSTVLSEAKKLDRLGHKELVVSGVNIGRYGMDGYGTNLKELLEKIIVATDFKRIRLSSINPQDVSDDLINLWASQPRLARHLHLSLQSGCPSVLTRMGRPYSAQAYFDLVEKIRHKIPEIAVTTDVIVGFPGETDQEFLETVQFVKKAMLAKIHVFRYSNRAGTKAARMLSQVSPEIKKERARLLTQVSKQLEGEFKSNSLGKPAEVLFEEQKNGYWYGLTSNYIRVKYQSDDDLYNKLKSVEIKKEDLS